MILSCSGTLISFYLFQNSALQLITMVRVIFSQE